MDLAQARYGDDARSLRWLWVRIRNLPPDAVTWADSARSDPEADYVELEPMTSKNTYSSAQLKQARPDLFAVPDDGEVT